MWQVRYLLTFNRLLVLYKSKTIVKIRYQILCVRAYACVQQFFVFVFLLFAFFRSRFLLIFYILFNYLIIIKLKHIINTEGMTTCASSNDFFMHCFIVAFSPFSLSVEGTDSFVTQGQVQEQ